MRLTIHWHSDGSAARSLLHYWLRLSHRATVSRWPSQSYGQSHRVADVWQAALERLIAVWYTFDTYAVLIQAKNIRLQCTSMFCTNSAYETCLNNILKQLYDTIPPKKQNKSQILLKSQTQNFQDNDLQKKPNFYNFALKKPIWQTCPTLLVQLCHAWFCFKDRERRSKLHLWRSFLWPMTVQMLW